MSSILSTVPLYVLSNSMALNKWLDNEGNSIDWKLPAYIAFEQRDSSRPEHVFSQRWSEFDRRYMGTKTISLMQAIRLMAEGYLEFANRRLYVRNQQEEGEEDRPGDGHLRYGKSAHFSRWQNIRARMTTWPIKLYMLHKHHCPACYFLAHPLEPVVADFIRTDGLNETHLHLNGCRYPEEEWLHDLYAIRAFVERETKDFKKSRFKEHYALVNPELTPKLLGNRMKLARVLRESIISLVECDTGRGVHSGRAEKIIGEAQATTRRYSLKPDFFTVDAPAVLAPQSLKARMQQEMHMWMDAFRLLENASTFPYKQPLQTMLHLYLLMQNEHIALNSHTEHRKGFEAFSVSNDHQKLSVGNAEYYENTFYNMIKTAAGDRNYIEVRLTPKALREKKGLFLRSCSRAWNKRQGELKKEMQMRGDLLPQSLPQPQLVLVGHMIKTPPKQKIKTPPKQNKVLLQSPLFEAEFRTHMNEAALMSEDARYLMERDRIPVGIDAANSEMNQPPEVFAPAYRLFEQKSGISHKTYHCGEDFLHLISGIRAVYDSVTFLDLRNGNRIGHGISIGIHPGEWVGSMPSKLLLTMREWLLDMIFVWKLLHEHNPAAAAKAEHEALRVAGLVFESATKGRNLPYGTIHTLADFFDMRQFVPTHVKKNLDTELPISEFQESEHKLISKRIEQHGNTPAELYWLWSTNSECRKEQEKTIEVKTDFLGIPELLELQQRVQQLIAVRDVVIETLPVSNLRIGQIRHIQDHHVLRWLKVDGYTVEGDADMNICMGSDDPGVFATNIKNEYYHLYMALRNAGLPAHEAIGKLRRVNDAGRIYAFRELPDMNPTPFKLTSLLNNIPRKKSLWERMKTD